MKFLSEIAKRCNANDKTIEKIRNANTARNVQEIIMEDKVDGFFDEISITTSCKESFGETWGFNSIL